MVGRHKLVARLTACLVSAGALALALTLGASPSPARSSSACTPSWQTVPSASTELGVVAMAAQSPTHAWAVGGDGINEPAFAEHWDGERWSLSFYNPRFSNGLGGFEAVTAAGPSAAWAVGSRLGSSNGVDLDESVQLIMSWDGSRWRVDRTPKIPGDTWLSGVVAIAANDVWAVGDQWARPTRPHGHRTLIEHWNGSSWKVVRSPNGGPSTPVRTTKSSWAAGAKEPLTVSTLDAIAAISPNDIWAVGGYDRALRSPNTKTRYRPTYRVRLLSEHWNGTRWTLGPTPVMDGVEDLGGLPTWSLQDVFADPSGDVVGLREDEFVSRPVWWLTGSGWTPDHSWKPMYSADAIAVTNHDDAWVMGWATKKGDLSAAHWDGNQWLITGLPATGHVYAAAASAADDVWAGGVLSAVSGSSSQQVMLHYAC
jgi:hypothetical protein